MNGINVVMSIFGLGITWFVNFICELEGVVGW